MKNKIEDINKYGALLLLSGKKDNYSQLPKKYKQLFPNIHDIQTIHFLKTKNTKPVTITIAFIS